MIFWNDSRDGRLEVKVEEDFPDIEKYVTFIFHLDVCSSSELPEVLRCFYLGV